MVSINLGFEKKDADLITLTLCRRGDQKYIFFKTNGVILLHPVAPDPKLGAFSPLF